MFCPELLFLPGQPARPAATACLANGSGVETRPSPSATSSPRATCHRSLPSCLGFPKPSEAARPWLPARSAGRPARGGGGRDGATLRPSAPRVPSPAIATPLGHPAGALHELELWFGDPQATRPRAGKVAPGLLVPQNPARSSAARWHIPAPGQKQRPHPCCSRKRASTPPAQPQLSPSSQRLPPRSSSGHPKVAGSELLLRAPAGSWRDQPGQLRLPWCTAQ